MITRLGLRARLTLLVTAVFACALILSTVLVLRAVEDRLVADTRASAEGVLVNYLDSIYGGVATIGVVDPTETTRFFYLDEDGSELTIDQYFEALATGFGSETSSALTKLPDTFVPDAATEFNGISGVLDAGVIVGPFEGVTVDIGVDPATGEILLPDGESVAIIVGPTPQGAPSGVEIGDDVVAVSQTLEFPDGTTLDIGVSSPLQPVTESLDTIRRLLWVAVPVLIAAIAGVTWLATSRALQPVHAISEQAQAITAVNIGQRVPAPPASDEIHELATTVNAMLDRLDRSQQRQRQLVADASHELRSPVAATRAQLEVARANPATTDWVQMVDAVLSEQEHLSTLIDDLLALSRLDEAGAGITRDLDLDELVAVEAARYPNLVQAAVDAPVRVSANTDLVARAVRNLIANAARHAVTEVVVTLGSDSATALIQVDDDGPGVSDEHHEAVFARFTRLDEARDRDHGGAGLGLAIAREVARAHGGDVTIARSHLGGARFTLSLPRDTANEAP